MTAVAVIGMAGRFPGAPDTAALWRNLLAGRSSLTRFDAADLTAAGIDPALLDDPAYVPVAGVVDDVEGFDAALFGYSPREAALLDPQHRHFLETCWAALEDAGHDPTGGAMPVGVFGGARLNTYLLENLLPGRGRLDDLAMLGAVVGNDKDFLTTAVSYRLGLTGPSLSVQTACSTSLVATHLAVGSLLSGECDMAVAGGAAIAVPHRAGYRYHPGGIYSPDGECRAFSAGAAGTVGGSGVAAVVLRRLDDALADGDPIRAVILGSAVNNDGRRKVGFTAPGVDGQTRVIAEALGVAEVSAATVGYVQAHGTGTPLGDPIEVAALTDAYRADTDAVGYCALGSVKPNLGHLDAAAGVTGLIAAVLAVSTGTIPPTRHAGTPHPALRLETTPFFLPTEPSAWRVAGPRRAGVSAFGIGGTNAHVIVEEPPTVVDADPGGNGPEIIVVSARTPQAAAEARDRLAAALTGPVTRPVAVSGAAARPVVDGPGGPSDPATATREAGDPIAEPAASPGPIAEPAASPGLIAGPTAPSGPAGAADLAAVARTLRDGRAVFAHRIAVVAGSASEAAEALRRARVPETAAGEPRVVFLFPGQGAQRPGAGVDLYRHEPVYRKAVDDAADLLRPHLDLDIRDLLHADAADTEAGAALIRTRYAQPALFTVGHALAELWDHWGVEPDALLGHSLGEYVAATRAGVFDLPDALRIVARRGALIDALPAGAMLAVLAGPDRLDGVLDDGLALAAVNSSDVCVVSGPADAIERARTRLADEGVSTRPVATSHAFHSAMMDPAVAALRAELAAVGLHEPRRSLLSGRTGTWMTAAEATDPGYWAAQLRDPVRFADALAAATAAADTGVCLELGPGRTLTGLAAGQLPAGWRAGATLGGAGDQAAALSALGLAWCAGVDVDWGAATPRRSARRVPLPTYPFARTRHWIERPPTVRGPDLGPTAPTGPGTSTGPATSIGPAVSTGPATSIGPATSTEQRTPTGPTTPTAPATPTDMAALSETAALGGPASGGGPPESHPPIREATTGSVTVEVAAIWTELLGVTDLTPEADFYELGGHSLLAAQVLARLHARYGIEPGLDEVAAASTFGAQVALVTAALGDRDPMGEQRPLAFPRATPRPEGAPLSPAQRRLWAIEQIHPGGAAYHLPFAVRVRGDVDVARLERALGRLVARHEALRTRFVAIGGVPRQQVMPAGPVRLDTVAPGDLAAEVGRPFDLTAGPCVRFRWERHADRDHLLVVTAHHMVVDGWSVGVLVDELARCYADPEADLGPPPPQPADVAALAYSGNGLEFWTAALDGFTEALDLPAVAPGTPGGRIVTRIGPDTVGPLRRRLYPALLAALGVTLGRTYGARRMVIGSPVANRPHPDLERTVGLLANTLPVPVDIDGDPTGADLVARLAATVDGALRHADTPLDRVVAATRAGAPDRDLFSVLLVLQNAALPPPRLGDLDLSVVDVHTGAAKFALAFDATPDGDGLRLSLEYAAIDEPGARRLLDRYARVLSTLARDPDRRVSALPVADADESRQVDTWAAGRPAGPATTVTALVAAQVAATPDAPAVIDDRVTWTYRDLDRRAGEIGAALAAAGVRPRDRVGLNVVRSADGVAAILAVLRAGATYVPLDVSYPPQRLAHMLDRAGARHVLSDGPGFAGRAVIALPPPGGDLAPAVEPGLDDLCYAVFTSGSTGTPKGIGLTHRALGHVARWQVERSALAPGARTAQLTPYSFDVHFQEIFGTLAAGGVLVVGSDDLRRDPDELLGWLAARRVERLFLPFVLLAGLAGAARRDPHATLAPSLREIATAGERLQVTPAVRELFARLRGTVLDNHYGPAESHVVTAERLTGDAARWPDRPTIGRPLPGVRCVVRDATGGPAAIGAPGELYLGGPQVASGYLDQPDATAERFRDGLYRTGDLVRWLADGRLDYLGRTDDQVKIRGHRVEPGEIEVVLGGHPRVDGCAVVAEPGPDGRARLAAYAETAADPVGLREWLAARLPAPLVPARVVALDRLPRTPSGKVDRRRLADVGAIPVEGAVGGSRGTTAQHSSAADALDTLAPHSPATGTLDTPTQHRAATGTLDTPAQHRAVTGVLDEPTQRSSRAGLRVVLEVMASVLDAPVGPHDDFFAAGGDSILAIELAARLTDAGHPVAPRDVFAHPTPAALAAADRDAPRTMRPTARQLARLSAPAHRKTFDAGRHDGPALRDLVDAIARRHPALRARIGAEVTVDDPAPHALLHDVDLTTLAPDMARRRACEIADDLTGSLDPVDGPVFRVALCHLPDGDRITVAAHPCAVDEASWTALLALFAPGAAAPDPVPDMAWPRWLAAGARRRPGPGRHRAWPAEVEAARQILSGQDATVVIDGRPPGAADAIGQWGVQTSVSATPRPANLADALRRVKQSRPATGRAAGTDEPTGRAAGTNGPTLGAVAAVDAGSGAPIARDPLASLDPVTTIAPADLPLSGLSVPQLDALIAERGLPQDIYPLTPMQRTMLARTLDGGRPGLYAVRTADALPAALDPAALRAAFAELVARHPILRTSFAWAGLDQPVQVVAERAVLPWLDLDWRDTSGPALRERLDRFLADDFATPFHPARAPLARCALIRLRGGYELVFTTHHLLMDGWSRSLLMQDLPALYARAGGGRASLRQLAMLPRVGLRAARALRRAPELPAVPPPFRDHVEAVHADDPAPARDFWRGYLAGGGHVGTAPDAAFPMPGGGYRRRTATAAARTVDALAALAASHGVTPAAAAQAAWALLLHRRTGASRVRFGVTASGRRAELPRYDRMIGLFITTLPRQVDIDADTTGVELARRLQADAGRAQAAEQVALLDLERDHGGPLFDSIVVVDNFPQDAAQHELAALLRRGHPFAGEHLDLGMTEFPLRLEVIPVDGLHAALCHHRDRYGDADAQRLLDEWLRLLTAIAENPRSRVRDLR